MEISDFENNPELKEILKRARTILATKVYSDVVDDAGNQYIDLVMEGGGMLGIALVGYIYVLENAGLRFRGIGGTSAGSITALLLAAMDVPAKPKGRKLLAAITAKNFYDFVDGGPRTRSLINEGLNPKKDIFQQSIIKRWLYYSKILGLLIFAARKLWRIWGLNPANTFYKWITKILEQQGIRTTSDLRAIMNEVPKGLRVVNRLDPFASPEFITTPEKFCSKLAIIASDVSTESKVEFPLMGKLYWDDPDAINPANYVRASMAIPVFFRPHIIKNIPNGADAVSNWKQVGYEADVEGVPEKAIFMDGGLMSNFPIDIFHTPYKVPDAPTFGVKLELDKRRHIITNIFGLIWAMFNSARHTLDYDFISKNPDYRLLVKHIPAKNYNWLDFNMSSENKINLFLEGARCANTFLTDFNWGKYKELRKLIADENSVSSSMRPSKSQGSSKNT